MNEDKIEAIIFDLGGVVLGINYHLTVTAFQNLGFSNFDEQYSQMKQSGLFDKLERGEISEAEFVSTLKKEIPHRKDQEIIDAWNAIILDFPDGRIDFIQRLRSSLPCFLLSNTNEVHLKCFNQVLANQTVFNDIHECFDKAYLSHEIQSRKPETNAWGIIQKEQGLEPAKCLFIDDSPQHIAMAESLGFATIHLTDINQLEEKLTAILT